MEAILKKQIDEREEPKVEMTLDTESVIQHSDFYISTCTTTAGRGGVHIMRNWIKAIYDDGTTEDFPFFEGSLSAAVAIAENLQVKRHFHFRRKNQRGLAEFWTKYYWRGDKDAKTGEFRF